MRVLVTGAYGLIGAACLARLHRDGHEVTGAGRAIRQAERRAPYAKWIAADLPQADAGRRLAGAARRLRRGGELRRRAAGRHARRRAGIHVAATSALFAACEAAGIKRVVHISAIGASALGADRVRAQQGRGGGRSFAAPDLDWVILRRDWCWRRRSMAAPRCCAGSPGLPFVTPVLEPDARLQVVSVDDVADGGLASASRRRHRSCASSGTSTHPDV